MSQDSLTSPARIAIVGAGPAGLMAAERLAQAGHRVVLHEQMPSAGRKFLMAGRGGLNLTHSEPIDAFLDRYGRARPVVSKWVERFGPADLIVWAESLGQATFVGSSGRIFPHAMKASPLLRAWLGRLQELGVELRLRSRWTGWQDGVPQFESPQGPYAEPCDGLLLALGGASWPRLGSDGHWTKYLTQAGVLLTPFRPANMGFNLAWSDRFKQGFSGHPLKSVGLSHQGHSLRGEVMIANYGLEGGGMYALSAAVRDAIETQGQTRLILDLRPDQSVQQLAKKLRRPRGKDSVSNWLRKALNLDRLSVALLHETGPIPAEPEDLAHRIKAIELTLTGHRDLSRAISAAGGVVLDAVDQNLMLTAMPGVFVAGEMLDWEAPTGGYLLQASLASGVVAAEGIQSWWDSLKP